MMVGTLYACLTVVSSNSTCNSRFRGIVFSSATAFRALGYFESRRAGLAFHFQAGAMPKVETLRLQLGVQEVKTCGVSLGGIEHLPSLKRVAIGLGYSGYRNEEPERLQ
nr:unnamed protein product [Digitaria exilis]